MKPVGYLFNHQGGIGGERGLFYNYIFASNGIFIEAENKLMQVRIPVAYCDIRGLAPIKERISLLYGSIPQRFFDLALNTFLADPDKEHYVAVTGDAGYHFYMPVQDSNGGSVTYEIGKCVVLELHSHGYMRACFSSQDDKDEKGLKFSAVIGKLNATPVVKLRLGVYGYYLPLAWKEVFDGTLVGAIEFEEEEVIGEDELHGGDGRQSGPSENRGGGMWWHRWFRGRGSMPASGQQ